MHARITDFDWPTSDATPHQELKLATVLVFGFVCFCFQESVVFSFCSVFQFLVLRCFGSLSLAALSLGRHGSNSPLFISAICFLFLPPFSFLLYFIYYLLSSSLYLLSILSSFLVCLQLNQLPSNSISLHLGS